MNEPVPFSIDDDTGMRLRRSLGDARRAALALVDDTHPADARTEALATLGRLPVQPTARVLVADQIDQLLLQAVVARDQVEHLPTGLVELLKARRRRAVVSVLRQEQALLKAVALLEEIGVSHVVFKGALVRQLLYEKPYLRTAADVDILVLPTDATRAIGALQQQGFSLSVAPRNDTHEVSLSWHGACVDLHFNLFRPGRMRTNISPEIVARRVRRSHLWGPDDTCMTAIMLVHPAITDHVTGRLISAIDLDRWLRRDQIRWHEVLDLLADIGLQTAAWTMLRWTRALLGTPVPDEVLRALCPSRPHQKYLESWLRRDPARLYWRYPTGVRAGFSLAMHDRVADMASAIWQQACGKDRLFLDEVESRNRQ